MRRDPSPASSDEQRSRQDATSGRWRTVGVLVLGGIAVFVVDRVTGGGDWEGQPLPTLTRLGQITIGVGTAVAVARQAVRFVTGGRRPGSSDFGLPTPRKPEAENRDALR